MIRFFKWFFTGDGHLHRWKIIDTATITRSSTGRTVGKIYVMKCEECGNIKSYNAEV